MGILSPTTRLGANELLPRPTLDIGGPLTSQALGHSRAYQPLEVGGLLCTRCGEVECLNASLLPQCTRRLRSGTVSSIPKPSPITICTLKKRRTFCELPACPPVQKSGLSQTRNGEKTIGNSRGPAGDTRCLIRTPIIYLNAPSVPWAAAPLKPHLPSSIPALELRA